MRIFEYILIYLKKCRYKYNDDVTMIYDTT